MNPDRTELQLPWEFLGRHDDIWGQSRSNAESLVHPSNYSLETHWWRVGVEEWIPCSMVSGCGFRVPGSGLRVTHAFHAFIPYTARLNSSIIRVPVPALHLLLAAHDPAKGLAWTPDDKIIRSPESLGFRV